MIKYEIISQTGNKTTVKSFDLHHEATEAWDKLTYGENTPDLAELSKLKLFSGMSKSDLVSKIREGQPFAEKTSLKTFLKGGLRIAPERLKDSFVDARNFTKTEAKTLITLISNEMITLSTQGYGVWNLSELRKKIEDSMVYREER